MSGTIVYDGSMEKIKSFAGVGSRQTPPEIIEQMKDIAGLCLAMGYTLNSGGADGADSAFEEVYDLHNGPMNIFLPWPGFNNNKSKYTRPKPEAYTIGATVHPAWEYMKKDSVKALIARNMHQILGWSLNDPVEFVICWTADGAETAERYSIRTGGTGSAISLASRHNIPVFNLRNDNRFEEFCDFISDKHHGRS